jgi:hypothetical protein
MHPFGSTIFLSLLIFIIIVSIIQQNKTFSRNLPIYEPLEDYGSETIPMMDAPLAYGDTTYYLKNPDLSGINSIYKTITTTDPFTPITFNSNDNKTYYSTSEMNMDFKYFNNASNLGLYMHYNSPETTS